MLIKINHDKAKELLISDYTTALEQYCDNVAQSRKYDNRFTCSLRAGYPGPFQEEGRTFAVWMDTCNAAAYQILHEVSTGEREVPSKEELISLLPPIQWLN